MLTRSRGGNGDRAESGVGSVCCLLCRKDGLCCGDSKILYLKEGIGELYFGNVIASFIGYSGEGRDEVCCAPLRSPRIRDHVPRLRSSAGQIGRAGCWGRSHC